MMIKYFTTALIGITIGFQAISQTAPKTKILMPESEYQRLKQNYQLKDDVNYLVVPDVHPTPITQTAKKEIDEMNQKKMLVGSCSCLVPIDASFTVALAPNDDGSTGLISIPFNFNLYGTIYNSVYINNNGNITFDIPYGTYSAVPFPDPSYVMVAPFWADVDTRAPVCAPTSGLPYYKITSTYMIVQWKNVGYYNGGGSANDKQNMFQLIITNGTDPILPAGNNVAFCYGDMQWTTGTASCGGGTTCIYNGNTYSCGAACPGGGFCGYPATVGVNKGDGTNFIQFGRFDHPGIDYDGGGGNPDGVSWLDNQSMYFNVATTSNNIAPLSSGFQNCDTLHICGVGDTLLLSGLFLAPEVSQITTLNINLNSTPGATVLSNTSGNIATGVVQIIADSTNCGNNVITFTATDDGIPVGTTVINVNVFVDCSSVSSFNPIIAGVPAICAGATTTLSVTPTTYDSYIWNTGAVGTSITVGTAGQYYCTVTSGGCSKTVIGNVIVAPAPTPLILGPLFTCSSNPTTLTVDSTYVSYLWNPSSTNDSIDVLTGPVTVTVTDSNGCVGTSPPVTVVNANPSVTITPDPPPSFCPGDNITLTATPSILTGANYLWSTGSTLQTTTVSNTGNVIVNVTYSNGCNTADTIVVTQFGNPVANFSASPPSPSAPNTSINFTDLSTVSGSTITGWNWNFGDGTPTSGLQNPTHSYSVAGVYVVTLAIQDGNGCWDTIKKNYEVISVLHVPNVFTPGNGGPTEHNQYFYIENLEYYENTLVTIYNRWGRKVYENKNYHNDWNGGTMSDGTYYYIISGTNIKETLYGFVQIIR